MPLWESGICLDFEYRPSEGCRCTGKAAYCSPIIIKQEKQEKYLISSNRSGIRRFVLWKEKYVIHRIVFLLNRENRTQMYFHSIVNIDDLSINILFINFYSSKNTKKKIPWEVRLQIDNNFFVQSDKNSGFSNSSFSINNSPAHLYRSLFLLWNTPPNTSGRLDWVMLSLSPYVRLWEANS